MRTTALEFHQTAFCVQFDAPTSRHERISGAIHNVFNELDLGVAVAYPLHLRQNTPLRQPLHVARGVSITLESVVKLCRLSGRHHRLVRHDMSSRCATCFVKKASRASGLPETRICHSRKYSPHERAFCYGKRNNKN